jgi:site-specific DNA recombinase
MERVITYCRVSTDEQASQGYSLRDQKDKLEKYCTSHGYAVAAHYQEDYSAKTFDRPEFKKLLAFVKRNKGLITKLIFIRWDRFSRNITDALLFIRELASYGVTCVSIDQPLDLSIPENKLLLLIYLGSPEIENDRRSINTTMGVRRAMKEGRWCNHAPYGYKYIRDEGNKPILVRDGYKADLVVEAFELFATGNYDKQTIRKMLVPKGMTLSRAAFANMFHNKLYAGSIVIKADKTEAEVTIKGVHEGLVTEEVFDRVQAIASGKIEIHSKPKTAKEELPLRGFLECPSCGGNLTGSASRARNGVRHFYYHCQKGCPTRFRADVANDSFEEWLGSVSLKPEHTDNYIRLFESMFTKDDDDRKKQLARITHEISKTEDSLVKLGKLYVEGKVEDTDYENLKSSYKDEIAKLKLEKEEYQIDISETLKGMEFAFSVLSNLQNLWKELDLEGKRILIGSIISGKLIFDGFEYRTNPEGLFIKEMAAIADSHSCSVASTGIEPVSKV